VLLDQNVHESTKKRISCKSPEQTFSGRVRRTLDVTTTQFAARRRQRKTQHAPDDPPAIGELPSDLRPGWYAISVNFLYGYPHYAPDGRGGRAHFTRGAYNYFRRFQPTATAGYSIYIYHLSADDIEAALAAQHD
jgi:hypothetical protein